MIKILKASAGSGKTFNLALAYIRLILSSSDPYAYRHVLAVTFTNKATEEMKSRIIKELDRLATSPSSSGYIDELRKSTGLAAEEIGRRAKEVLCNILNDYSAFSISTIDRFFQRALKAFSHEIGQFASYQVELDKDSLVKETVDRILDSLTEKDSSLITWLTDSAEDQILTSGYFRLDDQLRRTAADVKSDRFREKASEFGVLRSRDDLSALRRSCREVISNFAGRVRSSAKSILDSLKEAGIDPEESNRKFMRDFAKYGSLTGHDVVEKPTDAFLSKAADSDKWFAKAKAKALLQKVAGKLDAPMDEFCACFGEPYSLYCTAMILYGQLYSMGLVGEIEQTFDALMKEKNVLAIDDSNTILKGIIDGSDTPFIYEKLGVRFEHFLLDEFQDTSHIQWDNFYPLIKDSSDAGNESLIVGDVKQSIYRWRNSDWELLGKEVASQFDDVKIDSLDSNWRSLTKIVEFNNGFYTYAAKELDLVFGTPGEIADIYSDVVQKARSKDKREGNVDVLFVHNEKEKDTEIEAIVAEVRRIESYGARPGDIGILVRTNVIGQKVASGLMQNGIPVVSDDSLTVKSSPVVRRIVSLLSFANNPEEKIGSYLAESLGIAPPSEYHSLVDLCEYFVRELSASGKSDCSGDVAYVQAFMDVVQSWTTVNGNSLAEFLKYFEDDKVDPVVSSAEGSDAVRIMTIHKSKGLQFPYLIFPYAEAIGLYKSNIQWCHPDVKGTSLEDTAIGIYPAVLSSKSLDTLFAEDYRRERFMQAVDALNIMYVATTRAEKGMTVIAAMPSENTGKNAAIPFSNLSQLLHKYIVDPSSVCPLRRINEGVAPEDERYTVGTTIDFKFDQAGEERNPVGLKANTDGVSDYPSFPINPEEGVSARLKFSREANDFFAENGSVGVEASVRIRGIVLHDILSRIKTADDVESAVAESLADGTVDAVEAEELLSIVQNAIASADPAWFPKDGSKVYNESAIVDSEGEVHRPDRVVVSGDTAIVIDYKFGHPERKYHRQVSEYMSLYRAMGYSNVRGYLWYILDGNIEFC